MEGEAPVHLWQEIRRDFSVSKNSHNSLFLPFPHLSVCLSHPFPCCLSACNVLGTIDLGTQHLISKSHCWRYCCPFEINPLNAELNPICHLLALLGAHHILHVSRVRVKICRTRLSVSPCLILSMSVNQETLNVNLVHNICAQLF